MVIDNKTRIRNKTKSKAKLVSVKKICLGHCQRNRNISFFWGNISNREFQDGYYPICKDCVNDEVNHDDLTQVKEHLKRMNKPFKFDLWESYSNKPKPFGKYMRHIITLPPYSGMTWEDSDEDFSLGVKSSISDYFIDKWGSGFTSDEYDLFEKKYNKLKENYPKNTTIHIESLCTYVRYKVKEELCTAKDNVKGAKEWGILAKNQAIAAKINPNQLSKADLMDGLDDMSQLSKAIEEVEDIIEVLPKFIEKPQDKVDFTIWCYINYIRLTRGLAECAYKDIYAFYEDRKNNFKETFDFLKDYQEEESGEEEDY